ncbi:serine hydrolase, partial [Pandoraea nosoerga]|nr:serine hydrolase [Pandoraea nosoerga]
MFEPVRRLLVTAIALSATALPAALVAPTAQAQIPYSALRNTTEGKYAAVVVDANTGEVLFAKNADSQRYPASLTKIMTMYLTFEALASGRLKATDTLVVSPRAAA